MQKRKTIYNNSNSFYIVYKKEVNVCSHHKFNLQLNGSFINPHCKAKIDF